MEHVIVDGMRGGAHVVALFSGNSNSLGRRSFSNGCGKGGCSSSLICPTVEGCQSSASLSRSSACVFPEHCSFSGGLVSGREHRVRFLHTDFVSDDMWSLRLIRGANSRLGRQLRRRNTLVLAKRLNDEGLPTEYSSDTKMRSEVISPFRTVRMFFYLAFIASGAIGSVVTLSRLGGALANAPYAAKLPDILKDLGIDLAAVAVFTLLYRSDARARDISLAKLSREEILSTLRVELINKKVVTLQQLRGVARIVIISGPSMHIEEAFRRSVPFKEALLQRGVLVVPYTIGGARSFPEPSTSSVSQGGGSVAVQQEAETERWTALPIYTDDWSRWLKMQKKLANVPEETPVYISLRLDGRVRGSGVGFPPWEKFAHQLPPLKGIWKGPLDGMDGRI